MAYTYKSQPIETGQGSIRRAPEPAISETRGRSPFFAKGKANARAPSLRGYARWIAFPGRRVGARRRCRRAAVSRVPRGRGRHRQMAERGHADAGEVQTVADGVNRLMHVSIVTRTHEQLLYG